MLLSAYSFYCAVERQQTVAAAGGATGSTLPQKMLLSLPPSNVLVKNHAGGELCDIFNLYCDRFCSQNLQTMSANCFSF